MVKKSITTNEQIAKVEKLVESIPFEEPRDVKVITTPTNTLILIDDSELYSLEWDCLRGFHYLLHLTCEKSVRQPI